MGRKKGVNKIKSGFSLDIQVSEIYDRYCDVNDINRSKLMNKIVMEFLKNKGLYKINK